MLVWKFMCKGEGEPLLVVRVPEITTSWRTALIWATNKLARIRGNICI